MSRSGALPVGSQGKPSGWAPAVAERGKCFLRYVLSVARIPKFPSNPEKADRYIAASVLQKSERTTNTLII